MIEINRSLYMDERDGSKLPEFPQIRDILTGMIKGLMASRSFEVTASPSP